MLGTQTSNLHSAHNLVDSELELFRKLVDQSPGENVFISPPCISALLEMLLTGTVGETRKELLEAMGSPSAGALKLDAEYWRETLRIQHKNLELLTATSLWIRYGFSVKPEFLSEMRERFDAAIRQFDCDEDSVKQINAWVSDATRKKIPAILRALDPLDLLIGITAVYFRGFWRDQFPPDDTVENTFNCSNGSLLTLPFMQQQATLLYTESEEVQVVELPYANEGVESEGLHSAPRFAMFIVLPRKRDLSQLCRGLSHAELETWFSACCPREVWLEFPRFKFRYDADLIPTLEAMGVQRLFCAGGAELGGIADAPIYVRLLSHISTLEVNERGAEASAVTFCSVGFFCSEEPVPPVKVSVDRPFLCIIRDNVARRILFMGAVERPTEP
jgi:serine protease inhibitor